MPVQKGHTNNPNGRPRKPEVELVRAAIACVEKEKKKSLWKHLVEQAYIDNSVLVALAKKFVPDLTKDEGVKDIVRTFIVRANVDDEKNLKIDTIEKNENE